MITTICLNPSFDKTVEVEKVVLGDLNRTLNASREDVGSKGILVALAAKRLGLDVQAIGCMGRDGAERVKAMLDSEGINHAFLPVPGQVRTNYKIIDRTDNSVTEFNEPGAALAPSHLRIVFTMAREKSAASNFAVLTGALPPGCPEGTYRDLMKAVDIPCILDTDGPELNLGMAAHPFLIKPNLRELEQSIGRRLKTLEDIRQAAEDYLRRGAQHVIVSLGGDGALYTDGHKTLYSPSLKVDNRSSVGAGSAMLGGVLRGMQDEKDMAWAFRYGMAAGAASVMASCSQMIVLSDFYHLLDQVQIRQL